ncbi:MAG: hypothetical protein R3E68_05695 [Burkholderiaceae bacterium]
MSQAMKQAASEVERMQQQLSERLEQVSRQLGSNGPLQGLMGGNNHDLTHLGQAAIRLVREKPIASLLIGAGLVSLTLGGSRDASSSTIGKNLGAKLDKARSQAREQVEPMAESVRESASEAKAAVNEFAERAHSSISDGIEQGVEQVRRKSEDLEGWARENPMTASLVTMAIGAAITSLANRRQADR